MEECVYTRYDNECIFILGIEIIKMLLLEEQSFYIDAYYGYILEIYEDYKKYDDNKVSLLESIHNYINKNEQKILSKIEKAFNF